MSAEEKKVKDFSIWDSVVYDKIIQFEELEEKYNSRELQIGRLIDENGKIKDENAILRSKMDMLVSEIAEKQDELTKKQNEVDILMKHIKDMENSTSWKITKPIRKCFDKIRR